jgi:tRNA pseudouridine32 synthase/23S rRNA pseudouridine746 synthase/23S rRNA pseudouridine1911/1915/1917 synthase
MGKRSGPNTKHLPKGLAIVHEDAALLVVDKPAGLLTMGTETEKSRTAYFALTDYVRKGSAKSKNRIFVVHRLDRDTSGILIFAKTKEAKFNLQSQWKATKKKYLAVVHGRWEKPSGTMTSYLTENKAHRVYATGDTRRGKLSSTGYKVLKETRDFALLEVDPLTGRKHQIRVHLADHGHPIVGDKRYGHRNQTHKRMALHALSISIRHPVSGAPCTFETKVPEYFWRLVGSLGQADAQQANPPEAQARQ